MNDCVSCFFWRTVQLDLGAVVLFDDARLGGNRSVLFLSEWEGNKIHSIAAWYLQDRVSAIDWSALNDRQQVGIFANSDGSGDNYGNVKGWGSFKSIADLGSVGFNDRMSSFNWIGLAPKKEVMAPVNMTLTFSGGDTHSVSQTLDFSNRTSVNQTFKASISDSASQTLTVSTTETMVVGYKLSYTESWKVGVPGEEMSGSLSLELSQSYSVSDTSTTSQTKTIQLAFEEGVIAVHMAVTRANLVAQIGTVPPTTFTTTAQRWYNQPVTGSVQDPSIPRR